MPPTRTTSSVQLGDAVLVAVSDQLIRYDLDDWTPLDAHAIGYSVHDHTFVDGSLYYVGLDEVLGVGLPPTVGGLDSGAASLWSYTFPNDDLPTEAHSIAVVDGTLMMAWPNGETGTVCRFTLAGAELGCEATSVSPSFIEAGPDDTVFMVSYDALDDQHWSLAAMDAELNPIWSVAAEDLGPKNPRQFARKLLVTEYGVVVVGEAQPEPGAAGTFQGQIWIFDPADGELTRHWEPDELSGFMATDVVDSGAGTIAVVASPDDPNDPIVLAKLALD